MNRCVGALYPSTRNVLNKHVASCTPIRRFAKKAEPEATVSKSRAPHNLPIKYTSKSLETFSNIVNEFGAKKYRKKGPTMSPEEVLEGKRIAAEYNRQMALRQNMFENDRKEKLARMNEAIAALPTEALRAAATRPYETEVRRMPVLYFTPPRFEVDSD